MLWIFIIFILLACITIALLIIMRSAAVSYIIGLVAAVAIGVIIAVTSTPKCECNKCTEHICHMMFETKIDWHCKHCPRHNSQSITSKFVQHMEEEGALQALICPCGYKSTENDKFCPTCGQKIVIDTPDKVKCFCDYEFAQTDAFCPKCGAESIAVER